MRTGRLTMALATGALPRPPGRFLAWGAGGAEDLASLGDVFAVQGLRPEHDVLAGRGVPVAAEPPAGPFAGALVCLPRSKAAARARIAAAAARVAPGGPVAVDGQKTDGIDAVLRDLRARVALGAPVAKGHGKLAVFAAAAGALDDWAAGPRRVAGGWVTAPGVFSEDGPDRGSALLAAALPARLPGRGIDLGAGWGFLAAAALGRDGVTQLDLVEADHDALACARINVTDPRARFHWADARSFRPGAPADFAVMNPPFHGGRAADPALGLAFLSAAARALAPHGTLWLVANRGLPYDRALRNLFREVVEIGHDASFRLCRAARPAARL
jgi:16S rRNA (guanine1207-N2)-methyltransferase